MITVDIHLIIYYDMQKSVRTLICRYKDDNKPIIIQKHTHYLGISTLINSQNCNLEHVVVFNFK